MQEGWNEFLNNWIQDVDTKAPHRVLYKDDDITPGAIKVLYCTCGGGGLAWYRCLQPANLINKYHPAEVNIVVTNFIHTEDLITDEWDIIVLQRQAESNVAKMLQENKGHIKPKLVVEFDDHPYIVPRSNPAYDYYKDKLQNITNTIQLCNAMTVSTNPLKDFFKTMLSDDKIFIVPNTIDLKLVEGLKQSNRYTDKEEIAIGWFGSATHKEDLAIIVDAVMAILKKYPHASFLLGGWDTCSLFPKRANIVRIPWVASMMEHYANLSMMDIAVCPLADMEFNTHKSNLKVIEAMSLGIPVVASDIYPYANTITHNTNGLLVRSTGATYKNWFRALDNLVSDHLLRKRLGTNGRSLVEKKYNQKLEADNIVEIYKKIKNLR